MLRVLLAFCAFGGVLLTGLFVFNAFQRKLGVANILSGEAKVFDATVLATALLHDTVENTNMTIAKVMRRFGDEIGALVDECTGDKSRGEHEREAQQVRHAPTLSHRAKLIKLADKLENLRFVEAERPEGWDEAKYREYFVWDKDVFDRLRGTNTILEDALHEIFQRNSNLTSE